MMNKKVKNSESKIESEMVGFLESECAKLGFEVEKEKNSNHRLRL